MLDSLSVAEALPIPLIAVIIVGFIFLLLWVIKQWNKDEVNPKKHWKSPSQSKPPTPTKRPFDLSGRPNKAERPERLNKEKGKPDKRERK